MYSLDHKSLMIIIFVVINFLVAVKSVMLWDQNPILRRSIIVSVTASGALFAIFDPNINGLTEALKITFLYFLIGCGFYFSIWIQCKD